MEIAVESALSSPSSKCCSSHSMDDDHFTPYQNSTIFILNQGSRIQDQGLHTIPIVPRYADKKLSTFNTYQNCNNAYN
jgi:hypothetical protein